MLPRRAQDCYKLRSLGKTLNLSQQICNATAHSSELEQAALPAAGHDHTLSTVGAFCVGAARSIIRPFTN